MGLKDGIPSLQVYSTEVSGSQGSFTSISGTELIVTAELAAGAVTSSVLASGNVMSYHISGAQILTAAISGGAVTATEIGALAVTSAKQKFIGTGSPTGYGLSVQTGQFVVGAGSDVAVVFGTAFAAAPNVVVAGFGVNAVGDYWVSGVTTAGFRALGDTASTSGTYIAVGSGAI